MLWPLLFMFIKKTKKSVKTDLKILMMRMIFFSLCTKILNDILILIFSKKKNKTFFFCFDDFTRQLDVELLREGQVEVAEVHLEQMLVLQHPQHNFLIFFAEGSVVLSSNVATSPAASMGLLVGCTAAAAVGGDKFFRSVVLSFSLEFTPFSSSPLLACSKFSTFFGFCLLLRMIITVLLR